ncbi:MAG: hypothetical protein JKY65_14775 [Planctomycetes bacterium]|nr:hypothetical protein [Planctomycetota bacterium]
MRTATLLGVLLTLTLLTPAHAQHAPQPLAGDVLAELLLRATDRRVLQHRLFTKRYYRADQKRGEVVLVTGEGKATESGFQFKVTYKVLSDDEQEGHLTYDFNAEGRLVAVEMIGARRGKKRGSRATIANGIASRDKIKDGQLRGKPQQAPWKGDMVSLFSALVLFPSLGDLGLEGETRIMVGGDDDRIGRGNSRPKEFVIRRHAPSEGLQVVMIEEVKRRHPIAKVVVGTGKDQGVIKEFVIDPKPDGRYDLRLTLITEKEVKELKKIAPLLNNEAKARRAMRSVWSAQRSFKAGRRTGPAQPGGLAGEYADSLKDLVKANLIYGKVGEGTSAGYLIMLRRAASGLAWMAVAVPDDPGKTGRYFYVTNQDGVTFRSEKPIELDDSCKIPPDLEEVGR